MIKRFKKESKEEEKLKQVTSLLCAKDKRDQIANAGPINLAQGNDRHPVEFHLSSDPSVEEKIAFNINSSENKIKTMDSEKLKINKNLSVIDSDFKLSENIMKNIDGKQYWKYSFYLFTVHNEYYEKAGYDMDQYSV